MIKLESKTPSGGPFAALFALLSVKDKIIAEMIKFTLLHPIPLPLQAFVPVKSPSEMQKRPDYPAFLRD